MRTDRALPAAMVLAAMALPATGHAGPVGGVPVSGDATITQTPGRTTIVQGSDKVILHWQAFDVGDGEQVQFQQPGAAAIALNRVVGDDASDIHGSIRANGHVWLINPRGILFGPTARVDVHGLVATTADIRDADFLAGSYGFGRRSDDPDAGVVNRGEIRVGEGGLAALVAPHVGNGGLIYGRLASVVLAGTPTFTLDLDGDGLIRFAATSEVVQAAAASGALVENSGRIEADGGAVLLTARAAADVVRDAIDTSGVIEAHGIGVENGRVVLRGGGSAGRVLVRGEIDAGAPDAGDRAGWIDVSGTEVVLADNAVLDVSGREGGGELRIGRSPGRTLVATGARLHADATVAGDGGTISMRGADVVYAGSASARGAGGGDGGQVETLARDRLVVTGRVDTSSPGGETGAWRIAHATKAVVTGAVSPELDPNRHPAQQATIAAAGLNASATDIAIDGGHDLVVDAAVAGQADLSLTGKHLVIRRPVSSPGDVRLRGKDVATVDEGLITAVRLDVGSTAPPGHAADGGVLDIDTRVAEMAVGAEPGRNHFSRIEIDNRRDLTLGTVDHSGIDAGRVDLRVDGMLTVAQPIVASGAGDAVVLVTDRFVNAVGPTALQTPAGRAIVYSVDPAADVRGGVGAEVLFGGSIATVPPSSISVPGTVFVYRAAPTPTPPPPAPPSGAGPPATVDPIVVPPPVAPAIPAAPGLDAVEEARVTQPDVVPWSEVAVSEPQPTPIAGEQRLVALAPPDEGFAPEDLLFANDGNRELWGPGGGP